MLEEGKIYIVKVSGGSVWLFKKRYGLHSDRTTGCNCAICLEDMYTTHDEGYVCRDSEIVWIKIANENYIAIWNRVFNDNIELR